MRAHGGGRSFAGHTIYAVTEIETASPRLAGRHGLVTVIEALHDMSQPVEVLRERVADSFSAPGDDVERLCCGFSVLHCLPVGMPPPPASPSRRSSPRAR